MVQVLIEEIGPLVAVAAKTNWGDLTGAEAAALLPEVERVHRQLDVIRAGLLDRVATSREFEADGHPSAAAWMQSACGTKASTARQVQRDGRVLRHCPGVDDAARAGELDLDKARLIAKLNDGRAAAGFSSVESYLVECARSMRFADLKDEVDGLRQVLDPDGEDERADRMMEDRFVDLVGTGWGCGDLTGRLEPLTKATVGRELERLEQELFDEDWTDARQRLGREPNRDELDRTATQRRHDALGLMAQRSAAFSGRLGPACCVNLHMGWGTYFAELARLEGRTDVAFPEDHLCELDDGTVIPASLAVNASFAGWIRRCVFGPGSEILDYGRARRLFTAVQRQAMIAASRRRRCDHEHGCDQPATRCQADHLTEYEDGGLTNAANSCPLCPRHNRWKTRNKLRRRGNPDDDPHPELSPPG